MRAVTGQHVTSGADTIKRILDRAHHVGSAFTVAEYRYDRDRCAVDRAATWLLDSHCVAMEETDAGFRPAIRHVDDCRCDFYLSDATKRRSERET